MKNKFLYKSLSLLLISILLVLNWHKIQTSHYDFVDFDGFEYLSISKSLRENHDFFVKYRSPMIGLLIYPNINIARLEVMFLHVINSILVYLIAYKISKRDIISIFSMLLFGTCWWLIGFTTNVLSENFSFLFLLSSLLMSYHKKTTLSMILFSFAFLLRPDSVFLLPLILYNVYVASSNKRNFMILLAVFAVLTIFIEAGLEKIFYGDIVFSYIKFFTVNFIRKSPFETDIKEHYLPSFIRNLPIYSILYIVPGIGFLIDSKRWCRVFILLVYLPLLLYGMFPVSDYRVFYYKAIFISSVFGATVLYKILKQRKEYLSYLMAAIVLSNFIFVLKLEYPEWDINKMIDCNKACDSCCSNFPSFVYFVCGCKVPYCENNGTYHYFVELPNYNIR